MLDNFPAYLKNSANEHHYLILEELQKRQSSTKNQNVDCHILLQLYNIPYFLYHTSAQKKKMLYIQ